jgi:hypothetical protein
MISTLISGMRQIKTAAPLPGRYISRLGRMLAHSPAAGATTGAVVGGASALATNPEGSDTLSTIERVGKGGLTGAAIGGGIGAASRKAVDLKLLQQHKGLAPMSGLELAGRTGLELGRDVAHVAERQVHGLLGTGSRERLDHIGMRGAARAAKETEIANLRAAHEGWGKEELASTLKNIADTGAQGEAARAAGITSLPGLAKNLVMSPVNTSKAIWQDIKGGPGGSPLASAGHIGMYAGLPAVAGGFDIARGDESAQGGDTVAKKVLRHGANIGTGFLTAGLPIGSGMIAQNGLMRPFGGG